MHRPAWLAADLAFELFQRQAGVSAVHVPYKGANAMMPDIMAGRCRICGHQRARRHRAGESGAHPHGWR